MTAPPGGYSSAFVSYLLRHRDQLLAGQGLPRKEWQLATRVQRARRGGAAFEYSAVLRADLEYGLSHLDETIRQMLLSAHQGGHPLYRMYHGRPTARTAGIRRTLEALLGRLTNIMNGRSDGSDGQDEGGADVTTKPETRVTQGSHQTNGTAPSARPKVRAGAGVQIPAERVPDGPEPWERELMDAYDVAREKLEKLRGPRWSSLTLVRGEDGKLRCRVTL